MRVLATVAIVLGCTGQTAATSDSAVASGRRTSCEFVAWRHPDTVRTSEGNLVYIENPQAITSTDGFALLGHWLREADSLGYLAALPDSGSNVHGLGIVVRDDGGVRRIPLPTSSDGLVWPAAARLHDDQLTVVWSPNDSFPYDASELLSADFAGGAWQNVQRAASGALQRHVYRLWKGIGYQLHRLAHVHG